MGLIAAGLIYLAVADAYIYPCAGPEIPPSGCPAEAESGGFRAVSHTNRAMLLWRARRYEEAIRESQQALDLDGNFVNAYWWQSQAWAGKGNFDRSIACLLKAISLNDGPLFRALLGHVYGRAGQKDKALSI